MFQLSNIYTGSVSQIPNYLTVNHLYYAYDTKELYGFNFDGSPILIVGNDENITISDVIGLVDALNAKVNKSGIEQKLNVLNASGDTVGAIGTGGERMVISGATSIALASPVIETTSLMGFEDFILGVGLNGSIIPIKKDFTSYAPVDVCTGSTAIPANIQTELCAEIVLIEDLINPTLQWNVNFTNNSNQPAIVTLQLGLNHTPVSSQVFYEVPKLTTLAIVGASPFAGNLVSGQTVTAFLQSDRPSTVNSATIKLNSGVPVIEQVVIDGSTNAVASNAVYDELQLKENAANKQNSLNPDGTGIKFPTLDAVNKEFYTLQSTGLLWGGQLSVNTNPARFNLATGEGYIINSSILSGVTRTLVSWPTTTGNIVTNLSGQTVTYILMNSDSTIHQQATFPTPDEKRARIFIGRLNHSSLTGITFTDTFPDLLQSPINQIFDLVDSIGPFSYFGNAITANGANLSINKTFGKMYNASFNYIPNNQSPNNLNNPTLTLATFRHQNQGTTDPTNITVIDPTSYDVAGVTTPVPNPVATTTAMRVYLFPSNTIRIQRGQTLYSNLAAGIAGYKNDPYIENPANTGIAVWVATIVVQKNCTSLLDTTTSRIIIEPKFGGSAGAAGVTTATLQTAYNNSVQPQIITDAIRGAIAIQRGTAADSDNVFEIRSGSGIITNRITGNGQLYISGSTIDVNTRITTAQITITTSVSIDTTTTVGGLQQRGRNVIINNGVSAINYTCNGLDGYAISFIKVGTAAITFVAGAGRTLVTMDGTAVLSGIAGSRASLSSVGTVDYLYITNY